MIYIVNINDKVYEVEVERGKANLIKTTQAAAPATAPVIETVSTENNTPVSQASITADNIKGESVKSPMPGTILEIKAKIGEKIKKGQLIIVLEAMKMENEIFAPSDGVVAQIYVGKGSSVSTNEILMAIQ